MHACGNHQLGFLGASICFVLAFFPAKLQTVLVFDGHRLHRLNIFWGKHRVGQMAGSYEDVDRAASGPSFCIACTDVRAHAGEITVLTMPQMRIT